MRIKRDSVTGMMSLFWAILLSIAWLLPNHFPPWASFHADAWFSVVALAAALVLFFSERKKVDIDGLVFLSCLVALIPWIQFAFDIIPFAGKAWVSSMYIFGFAVAMLLGNRWADMSNDQPLDTIFLAILIAALGSSGLTIGACLGVLNVGMDTHISMGQSGERYYANLGQPNLLATFLLWGCISGLWFYIRNKIGGKTALVLSVLFGSCISLTGSRQAYLGVICTIVLMWIYRSAWERKFYIWTIWLCPLAIGLGSKFWGGIRTLLYHGDWPLSLSRPNALEDLRFQAWNLFAHAALERPWFGYGWTEVTAAQLSVAEKFPALGGLFGHAHNILLDVVLWVGFPIAFFLILIFSSWVVTSLARIRLDRDVVILLALCVFGVHSMLELPHQYAIFLFPVGMMMGVLSRRLHIWKVLIIGRWVVIVFLLSLMVILFGVIRDYLRVEDSYNRFRFERKGFQYTGVEIQKVPDVIFLTQFKYWFSTVAYHDESKNSMRDLQLRERTVIAFPASGAMFELGVDFAKAGNAEKAKYWFNNICSVSSREECDLFKKTWSDIRWGNSKFYSIDWK